MGTAGVHQAPANIGSVASFFVKSDTDKVPGQLTPMLLGSSTKSHICVPGSITLSLVSGNPQNHHGVEAPRPPVPVPPQHISWSGTAVSWLQGRQCPMDTAEGTFHLSIKQKSHFQCIREHAMGNALQHSLPRWLGGLQPKVGSVA